MGAARAYAFVDPDNRVAESNEANNIAAWRVEIDCSPAAVKSSVKVTPSSSLSYSACGSTYYARGYGGYRGGYRLPQNY